MYKHIYLYVMANRMDSLLPVSSSYSINLKKNLKDGKKCSSHHHSWFATEPLFGDDTE